MRARLTPILWGAAGATVAFLVWLGGYHLYQDHQRLHAIWDLELQRAAQQQAAQHPPAPTGGS